MCTFREQALKNHEICDSFMSHRFWVIAWHITFIYSMCNLTWWAVTRNMSRLMRKTNKMACAPSKGSDQPEHPPSLIRVFAGRMKKDWVLSYPLSAQRRFWSDWANAQADLSLRWAHSHFVGLVMRRLICDLSVSLHWNCKYTPMYPG